MTLRSSSQLTQAVDTLRRYGFTPVYAQRMSASSTRPTGLWVVGKKLMKPEEIDRTRRKTRPWIHAQVRPPNRPFSFTAAFGINTLIAGKDEYQVPIRTTGNPSWEEMWRETRPPSPHSFLEGGAYLLFGNVRQATP